MMNFNIYAIAAIISDKNKMKFAVRHRPMEGEKGEEEGWRVGKLQKNKILCVYVHKNKLPTEMWSMILFFLWFDFLYL